VLLPVSNGVGYNKATSYNMYYNPKRFEEQGYPGLSQGQDRHIRTIMITLAHQVPSGPGPYTFKTVQWN